MNTLRSIEMSVTIYHWTRPNIAEDLNSKMRSLRQSERNEWEMLHFRILCVTHCCHKMQSLKYDVPNCNLLCQ